jgi:sodium/bile acid cotransporter 7
VVNGIWHKVGVGSLLFIVVVSMVLLAIVIAINVFVARRCGFNKADEITIVFCGSKKSLANGIPMANILFPTSILGIMVLPLMIFHQIQLMVCAVLARTKRRPKRYRRRRKAPPKPNAGASGADQAGQPSF